MRRLTHILLLAAAGGALVPEPAAAVERGFGANEFTFVRIAYDNYLGGGGRGGRGWGYRWGSWATDYPAAEENFLRGIRRLSLIETGPEPTILRLDSEALFEFPFIYMLEMGQGAGAYLSEPEVRNLREYLLRGGFLMIDDFWGGYQWANFVREIAKIFPERSIRELPIDHPIFHCFYEIDELKQIPGRRVAWDGYTHERDGYTPYCLAIEDDHGRVMILINFNTDLGDGWEHTYDQWYPTKHANESYRLGLNFLIYHLTH